MKGPRIIIVEDEIIISDNLKNILEMKGYHVVDVVMTGEGAVKSAETQQPDCILMDILLKGEIDGITAASEIKSILDIPIIYLTAYSDQVTMDRVKKTEPDGFLVKPFKRDDLYAAIDLAIYRKNMRHKTQESVKMYMHIINSAPDPIVILQDNIFKYTNKPFFDLFGYSQEDIDKGLSFYNLSEEKFRDEIKIRYESRMNEEMVSKTFRLNIIKKNGTVISCETSASLIKYNGRNADLVIIRDISERS